MSWSEDDWGKPFFPTRFGSPQGHATERKMLDAVGGFDGIRTKVRRNPDGSVTTLKTRGGMPVFMTVLDAIQTITAAAKYAALFYSIPSSALHTEGYTPDGEAGPVSKLEDWHLLTNYPADPEMNRVAAWDGGAGSKGNTTWYSDAVEVEGQPLILSWLTDGIRVGRYGTGTNSSVSTATRAEWNFIPGRTDALQLATQASAPLCHNWIWLNGVVRLTLPVSVMSAGIRVNTDAGKPKHELFVITVDGGIHSGSLDSVLTVSAGVVSINLAADGAALAMAQIGSVAEFADYQIMQWPFMNASTTKAVILRDTYTGQDGPKNTLYEVTLDSGALSVVDVENTLVKDKAAANGTYNPTSAGDFWSGSSGVTASAFYANEVTSYTYVSGADYVGDSVTFLTVQVVGGRPSSLFTRNESSSFTSTPDSHDPPNVIAHTETYSAVLTYEAAYVGYKPSVRLANSHFGEVMNICEIAASGIVSSYTINEAWTYSWVGNQTTERFPIYKTLNQDWPSCIYVPHILNGDLRQNTVLFSLITYREHSFVTESEVFNRVMPTQEAEFVSRDVQNYYKYSEELEVFLRQGNSTLFSSKTYFSEPVESNGGAYTFPSASWGNYAYPATHSEKATDTPTSYIFPGGNAFGAEEICPRVASLAVSPDGSVVYCGFNGFNGYFGDPVKKEVFVINGAVHNIPNNTYCPGGDDTLASAIFFPKTLIK